MIPGTLIHNVIGYCNSTPMWWAAWSDIVTRADVGEVYGWRRVLAQLAKDNEAYIPRTTDNYAPVINAYAPNWYRLLCEVYGPARVSPVTYPRPPVCALAGLGWVESPARSDECYASQLRYPRCTTLCSSYEQGAP